LVRDSHQTLITFANLKQVKMGMDKNTVIGFVLIGALLIAMFMINSRSNQAYTIEKKRIEDSIAAAKPKVDPTVAKKDSIVLDSLLAAKQKLPPVFITAPSTEEQLDTLENNLVKIVFTNKGGQPKIVELKSYKKFDGKPLILADGKFNKISYKINAGNNLTPETADIAFVSSKKTINADKSQSISFVLKDSAGDEITHQYTLPADSYLVDFNLSMNGANKLITGNSINLSWQTEAPQVEKSIKYERQQTHLCYVKNGSYDFEYMGSGDDKKYDKPLDWLALKQQFFISALTAKQKFQSATVKWVLPDDSLHIISQATANCVVPLAAGSGQQNIAMQLYYGPSDYNVLSKYNNKMENIVPYGSGVFAFVKYINRHFLLPVFDFLRNNIASMGMVILLLTLLIRLITSPILYKSYLSGAKMKALKPEIDRLKEKHGDDKQAFSMDQMKLWKSAGVSPLGGCLPALLQIPIFMSLYYFFQSNISLRGQNFLWAKDLAAYDSIATLPFSIPFYGDHVSLFTITATVTSLIISIYSMSNMQDNSNPVMKYMPYIFPVMLLGVFNNLPAALTWYYTVSNTITLILQIVIQKYIINHEKILAQIEENRKKPVKQSKLQERMLAMQENNKKLQDMKKKQGKN
jgi:YidC/Oxa1 family membrane protein insertase